MYRTTLRTVPRRIVSSSALSNSSRSANRFISTAPPAKKSRSWKSAAVRWGLAGAGVYYYNTRNVFAEEPEGAIQRLDESIHHIQESNLPTVDAIVEEKRRRQAEELAQEQQRQQKAAALAAAVAANEESGESAEEEEGEMGGLEEEADQQGAFNPETGEINWECPCLGGMAHGPCGEEFKAAFSCFVYSKEEPKGVECIDKFKGMQECFREHPEIYGSELDDDEQEVEDELRAREAATTSSEAPAQLQPSPEASQKETTESKAPLADVKKPEASKQAEESHRDSQSTTAEQAQTLGDGGGELLPKAVHDATYK